GLVVGVGDVVPHHRALARDVTYACHEALQLSCTAARRAASPRHWGGGNPCGRREAAEPTIIAIPPQPCCSRKRWASRAAMQPVPALVIAWRYTWSCTSPAAKTPGTLVIVAMPESPDLVMM